MAVFLRVSGLTSLMVIGFVEVVLPFVSQLSLACLISRSHSPLVPFLLSIIAPKFYKFDDYRSIFINPKTLNKIFYS